MDDKKKKDIDASEELDSLNPETIKGPQKDKHQNQYGDQDEASRVQ